MTSNVLSLFLDVKLKTDDFRPAAMKLREWTACQVKMEAIKCIPPFLRVTITNRCDSYDGRESIVSMRQLPYTFSVSLQKSTIVSLAKSDTRPHVYGVFWRRSRHACSLFLSATSQQVLADHMAWVRRTLEALETHRKLVLELQRLSRRIEDAILDVRRSRPLPVVPPSERVSPTRHSDIYQEIGEPLATDAAMRGSDANSGIYEELRTPQGSPRRVVAQTPPASPSRQGRQPLCQLAQMQRLSLSTPELAQKSSIAPLRFGASTLELQAPHYAVPKPRVKQPLEDAAGYCIMTLPTASTARYTPQSQQTWNQEGSSSSTVRPHHEEEVPGYLAMGVVRRPAPQLDQFYERSLVAKAERELRIQTPIQSLPKLPGLEMQLPEPHYQTPQSLRNSATFQTPDTHYQTPQHSQNSAVQTPEPYYQTPRRHSGINWDEKMPSYYAFTAPVGSTAKEQAARRLSRSQTTTPASVERKPATLLHATRRAVAQKISAHVYQVKCPPKPGQMTPTSTKSNNNNNAFDVDLNTLVQMSGLQNIDFKFDEPQRTPPQQPQPQPTAATATAARLTPYIDDDEAQYELSYKAAEIANKRLRSYSALANANANDIRPRLSSAQLRPIIASIAADAKSGSRTLKPSAQSTEEKKPFSRIWRFGSLPSIRRLNLSPLKQRINNALQRKP